MMKSLFDIRRTWRIIAYLVIAIALFFSPKFFWGNLYSVGGDDSRLYYIFPMQYLTHYSFHIMGNNTLGGNIGYWPVSYSAPTIAFLAVIKSLLPNVNTQSVAYGMILSLGFTFFFLLMREIADDGSPLVFAAGLVSSLFYILSRYITRTFFQHQLISIFLIMVVPVSLYFFVLGVKRRKMAFVLLAALFYSLFGSSVYGLPWFLPVFVTLLPFLYIFGRDHRPFIWKAIAVFFGAVIATNLYWIIHFVLPLISQGGANAVTKGLLSETLKKQNDDLIVALTHLNEPVNQLISHVRTSWEERQGPTIVHAIGGVYLLVILAGGIVLAKAKRQLRRLYIIAATCLLLAMIFVTPGFGDWNISLFQMLNNYVPFFVMFRNMYDKFALAMAFQYAFALYVALVLLKQAKVRTVYLAALLFLLVGVTLGNAYPYVHRRPSTKSAYSERIKGAFNQDFQNLTSYLAAHPTSSRYVWLPMTYPGYVYISDKLGPNHFYSGISPLQYLSGASDLAGFYGIQTPLDPQLNTKVFKLLLGKEYDAVGRILESQNVGYVIENKEKLPDPALVFMDAYGFMSSQSAGYRDAILGDKIRDFGSRYSIYAINPRYAAPTVFLVPDLGATPSAFIRVPFVQTENTYDISITGITNPVEIVLAQPYSRLWSLALMVGGKRELISTEHSAAYGYGNAWHIDPMALARKYPEAVRQVNGSYTFNLDARFWPDAYTRPALVISIIGAIGIVLYVMRSLWKK